MRFIPDLDPKLVSAKSALAEIFFTGAQEERKERPLVTSIAIGMREGPQDAAPTQHIVIFVEPVADCQLDPIRSRTRDRVGDAPFLLLPTSGYFGQAPPKLKPGDSISAYVPERFNVPPVAAGTLGAVLEAAGQRYLLGSNHVIAYNNRVHAGSPIVSPGTLDEPAAFHVVATRSHFVPLHPAAWPATHSQGPANINTVDCALAHLTEAGLAMLGPLNPAAAAAPLGTDVHKQGRSTGLTYGTLSLWGWEGFIDLSFGTFYFANLMGIIGKGSTAFAAPGDSGAVVIDDSTGAPIGMVMARAHSAGAVPPGGGAVAFGGYIILMCSMTAVADALSPFLEVAPGDIRFLI